MNRLLVCALFVIGMVAPAAATERGLVGIVVDRAPNFSVVTAVVPDSPAAHAGVRVGDRIVALDGYPTAKLRDVADFSNRVSGPPGSEIELVLERAETKTTMKIRLRRVAQPTPPPSQIPPGFDPRQVRSGTQGPNQAMQLTASKPAIYAFRVCRRASILRGMHRGLAAADLVSR